MSMATQGHPLGVHILSNVGEMLGQMVQNLVNIIKEPYASIKRE